MCSFTNLASNIYFLYNGGTSSLVAKNGTKKLSQTFEELQGLNSEFKLITPKSNTGTYFGTMVAILDTF